MLLIDVLRAGGWPEYELGNALGIVSHESGGNPTAHNPGTPSVPEDSWGLFQINRNAHAYSVGQLCDPVFNATVARQLWQGAGGYRDWYYAALALGLPPYGNAQHAVSEYAALANKEVGGGGAPWALDNTTMGVLAVLGLGAVALILD